MFGLDYERVNNSEALKAVYVRALQQRKSTIIEVQTDREQNLITHRDIARYLEAARDE